MLGAGDDGVNSKFGDETVVMNGCSKVSPAALPSGLLHVDRSRGWRPKRSRSYSWSVLHVLSKYS